MANSNNQTEVLREKNVKTRDTVKTQTLNFRFSSVRVDTPFDNTQPCKKINYISKRASAPVNWVNT